MLFFHLQKETQLFNFLNTKTLGPVILDHILLVISRQPLDTTVVKG